MTKCVLIPGMVPDGLRATTFLVVDSERDVVASAAVTRVRGERM